MFTRRDRTQKSVSGFSIDRLITEIACGLTPACNTSQRRTMKELDGPRTVMLTPFGKHSKELRSTGQKESHLCLQKDKYAALQMKTIYRNQPKCMGLKYQVRTYI